jgi:hypothetical protein
MFRQNISLPCTLDVQAATIHIERTWQTLGLSQTLKGGLQQYPEAIHWHLKHGKASGVLEVTFWPETNQLWLSVHRNRMADWIDLLLPKLSQALTDALEKACSSDG